MAKTVNFLDMPDKMNDLWEWVLAIDAWDYCATEPLSNLILKQDIPAELKNVISDIVSGKRKQNKKGAAKLKIPAIERMKIAGLISLNCGLIHAFKYDAIYPEGNGANGIGAMQGKEPLDVIRELEAEQEKIINDAANDLNVSVETIENLLRDLRNKMNTWPIV